jgi:hypothetical protein
MERLNTGASSVITMSGWARTIQTLGDHLVAIMILWAVSAVAWSAEGAGTIKTLMGSATVVRDSTVLPVVSGQRVFSGDRIVSGQDSYVGIMLHDDTRLTIGPGSELLIREFEFNPNTYAGNLAVSFLKGTARVVTGLMGKHAPERVRFHTPTATIGIRGTEFVVDLDPE